jgi:hypothetical protein
MSPDSTRANQPTGGLINAHFGHFLGGRVHDKHSTFVRTDTDVPRTVPLRFDALNFLKHAAVFVDACQTMMLS